MTSISAPRITKEDIEAAIAGEFIFSPSDYDIGCGLSKGTFDREKVKRPDVYHPECIYYTDEEAKPQ